jgi:hypothetical protein
VLDPQRAPSAHAQALPFQRLQPSCRQRPQVPHLRHELLLPPLIPPGHHGQHELPVRLAAAELSAATQQQRLLHGLLETPMALLAVAVLVGAVGVRCLGLHSVMSQQRPIVLRVLLRVAVVMHRQGHAVGPMPPRRRAQRPPGVLHSFTQARETLREAQADVLPVRVGQDEVVHQVRKRLALDRHPQRVHTGEIGRPEPSRLMHLGEEHLPGWAVLGTPLTHAPFQRPPAPLPVRPRAFAAEPLQQRLGLEARFAFEQLGEAGPHRGQRVRPRPIGAWLPLLAGQLVEVTVFASGLAIHAGLQRRDPERHPSLQLLP